MVFDLWNVIAYKVRICKTELAVKITNCRSIINVYQYRIDGSKNETIFAICRLTPNADLHLNTLNIKELEREKWIVFVKRMEKIGSTFILTMSSMFPIVKTLESKLNKFENGKIDLANLLNYEDDMTVGIINILNNLYENIQLYNFSDSFSKNIQNIFTLKSHTLSMNQKHKKDFLTELKNLNQDGKLVDYIKNGISTFYKIYDNKQKQAKTNNSK